MAGQNGDQPQSLGLPSGQMAGLARSLTASHRVLTALQDANKSPKTPVGAKSADNTPKTSPKGSAGSSAVDLHFRLYQQTERGSVEQSLRRVALTGSALDKAFAEEQVGTWGRMLAPAANREQVDSALATLIDVGNSPQTHEAPSDPFATATPAAALSGVCVMQLQRSATIAAYSGAPVGESNTMDYRLYMEKEGQRVSSWHDVSLRNPDGSLNFVCEIPKDTMAKMEVATGEDGTPIKQDMKKGKLRFYPYNIHWNYGMLPQTWEDPEQRNDEAGGVCVRPAHFSPVLGAVAVCPAAVRDDHGAFDQAVSEVQGDNDPVDVVEIGGKQLRTGAVYCVKLLGAYAMIDEGELDWKVIAIRIDDPLAAKMDNVDDVEREMPGELERIMCWFRDYKMPDGKPANRYAYDAKALDKAHAERVVMETHAFYLRLKAGTQPNTDGHVGLAAA